MKKTAFSLVIIAQNEEDNIRRCIESVPIATEVLVLDSGSTDSTVSVAESLGAKVVQQQWLGYGRQKRKAVELAAHDWILSLDADEALSSAALLELQEISSDSLDPECAYSFPRLTFLMGRGLRHGGNYPDRQVRFFHRNHAQWSDDQVHEKLNYKKLKKLRGDILHWSFRSVEHQIQTINKYSSLRAQMWLEKGKKASVLKIIFKPWSKFVQNYFFKLGFMDGFAGFEAAVVSSFSYFLRLVKLREAWGKKR